MISFKNAHDQEITNISFDYFQSKCPNLAPKIGIDKNLYLYTQDCCAVFIWHIEQGCFIPRKWLSFRHIYQLEVWLSNGPSLLTDPVDISEQVQLLLLDNK